MNNTFTTFNENGDLVELEIQELVSIASTLATWDDEEETSTAPTIVKVPDIMEQVIVKKTVQKKASVVINNETKVLDIPNDAEVKAAETKLKDVVQKEHALKMSEFKRTVKQKGLDNKLAKIILENEYEYLKATSGMNTLAIYAGDIPESDGTGVLIEELGKVLTKNKAGHIKTLVKQLLAQ